MSSWIQHWRLKRLLESDDSTRSEIATAIRSIAGLESYLLRLGRYTRRPFGRPYRGIEDILLGWGLRRVERCVSIFHKRRGNHINPGTAPTPAATLKIRSAVAGGRQAALPIGQ